MIHLFSILLFSVSLFAKDVINLSNPAIRTNEGEYTTQIERIREGFWVNFEKDSQTVSYRVGRILGEGHTTRIYELMDYPHLVLRIPKFVLDSKYHLKSYINMTIQGYIPLKEEGVPVVKIHDSKPFEYVVVDRVNGPTLETFLLDPYQFKNKNEMEQNLILFAKKAYRFEQIGDFQPEQIVYDDQRGWVLIDWDDNHKLNQLNTHRTFVETMIDNYSIFYKNDYIFLPEKQKQWLFETFEKVQKAIYSEHTKGTEAENLDCNRLFELL